MRSLLAIAALMLALGPGAAGQMRGGIPPLGGGLGFRSGRGFSGGRFARRRGYYPGYGLGYGYAYFDDPYFDEAPPEPEVVLMRNEAERAPMPARIMQPKLIEVPGSAENARPQPTVPTVLVWRSGQREEVKQYTISGPYLYEYGKPLQRRRIALDDLDLEATERVNQERGVQFMAPATPSEVTVRF
jgi:hypothetical protein